MKRNMKRILCVFFVLLLAFGSVAALAEDAGLQSIDQLTKENDSPIIGKGLLAKNTVKVKISPSKHTMKLDGDPYRIPWTVYYRGSWNSISYSNSNYSVVSLYTSGGYLYASPVGLGKAKVTVKSGKKKASTTLTVKGRVTDISAPKTVLNKGEGMWLTASTYPSSAADTVTWSSSNKKVATVSKYGYVTAKKKGTVTITAKGKYLEKYSIPITVTNNPDPVVRRGVILIEGSATNGSWDDRQSAKADADSIKKAFAAGGVSVVKTMLTTSASSPAVTSWSDADWKIRSALSGADYDDVSYIYIKGHGTNPGSSNSSTFGACIAPDASWYNDGIVTAAKLKRTLDQIPGTKVVFFDACHSGSIIGKGTEGSFTPQQFTQGFLNDFANAESSAPVLPKNGELASYGYHVLCSCSYKTDAVWNTKLGSYFAIGIRNGLTKSSGKFKADTNKDKQVSVYEIYDYAWDTVYDATRNLSNFDTQFVQYYSTNSSFTLFK